MSVLREKYLNELSGFEVISQAAGNRIDYVQGGGGNTSVKLDGELMAVKASGFKLKQINPSDGYVVVNYKNIRDYYRTVDTSRDVDLEKEGSEFVKQNIVRFEELKDLRPSVEAGFHSILLKYVIHTHSVYANILCCSEDNRELISKIFADKSYACSWVKYINPGFELTVEIQNSIDKCKSETGKFPQVIFMENHGLIVTADDPSECVKLHDEVNETIKDALKITKAFPKLILENTGENKFESKTVEMLEMIKKNKIDKAFLTDIMLYPDQLVYLNGNITGGDGVDKLIIDTTEGKVNYNTAFSEAETIEETLLGYVYVINQVKAAGLKIQSMSAEGVSFINNWESEKYRKSLSK